LTVEEELLAALVAADETLQEALMIYNNFESVAIEMQADGLSQQFVGADCEVGYILNYICTSRTHSSN
jgi:hypothetical protein